MSKEIIDGEYVIRLDTYSSGHFIQFSLYRNGIYIKSGGGYTETEALSDATAWIKIDKKERGLI